MVGTHRSRSGIFLALGLLATVPILLGQLCAGNGVTPVDTNTGRTLANDSTSSTGNQPPSMEFTAPLSDISVETGDVVNISWQCYDPDNNAAVEILLDPDGDFGNGNERVIVPLILEDSGTQSYQLDTSVMSLQPASYRVIATVNDGVNPELLVVAPGRILLFGAGLLPGNISPSVQALTPTGNLSLSQGDQATITYCARDRDNPGPSGQNPTPDVIVLLDTDDDPTNDLNLSAGSESQLTSLCTGGLPAAISGGIIISCSKKTTDCTFAANPADGTPGNPEQVVLSVDVGLVPPNASGEPYHVRVDVWDHINAPVRSYAPGTLNITALGSGVIDLGMVGRTISGAKFMGFDAGARTGSTGTSLDDFDVDGADDFIIVERYGRPLERGNVGAAFLIYGKPGQRYGGEISLNSLGGGYRGAGFMAGKGFPHLGGIPYTDGITSVTKIADLNNDTRPEILFGLPYVEGMYDYHDDDPCDDNSICYPQFLPNPKSNTPPGNDDMSDRDFSEGSYEEDEVIYSCSNDYDWINETLIKQGYLILVDSSNTLDNNMLDLPLVGMHDGGGSDTIGNDEGTAFSGATAPNGARFRGGWYDDFDLTQTRFPYSIIPDNRFGETVASMPDMSNGDISPQPDGRDELLISAPNMYRGKGGVTMVFGQNYSSFTANDSVSSIPPYLSRPAGGCRSFVFPVDRRITGAVVGDQLGYASSAGDFNSDFKPDILCGAPGATRDGFTENGLVYIIFGRYDFANVDLGKLNPPRVEIHGAHSGDRFGEVQALVGDMNGDSIPDVGIASPHVLGPYGAESGFVAVIFGGRKLTGENIFNVNQIGTAQLPGLKFYGSQVGGNAGAVIGNAGDFNGDNYDDLLIVAPQETRFVNGQTRRGVAYVVFGGRHLVTNPGSGQTYNLADVGNAGLPGMVIVSPYADGTADMAPIDWAGPAGDVDGDGFADIAVGVSTADFINPLEPSQRRFDSGECYLIYGSNTGSNRIE